MQPDRNVVRIAQGVRLDVVREAVALEHLLGLGAERQELRLLLRGKEILIVESTVTAGMRDLPVVMVSHQALALTHSLVAPAANSFSQRGRPRVLATDQDQPHVISSVHFVEDDQALLVVCQVEFGIGKPGAVRG